MIAIALASGFDNKFGHLLTNTERNSELDWEPRPEKPVDQIQRNYAAILCSGRAAGDGMESVNPGVQLLLFTTGILDCFRQLHRAVESGERHALLSRARH